MANTRRHHRGLSTVIGAVFMILVTVGALNVVLWTLQQQNRVAESIIEKSNSNLNKLNEEIDISNVRVDGNKLNMTVTNTGGATSTLKSIYIVNETANEQYRYDLDLVVDGRESLKDIGQTLPLIVMDDTRYSVRLITESGNTVTTTLTPLSSVALPMSIYVIPPTVQPGNNVTILFAVTNNLTDSTLGVDITPELEFDFDPSCTPGPSCELVEYDAPSGGVSLTQGNTMLFKWVYEANVPDATYITFNASLAGARAGNYVLEKAYAKLIDEAQISTSTTQVIYSSLVQKPEIFLVLPSPFGDNGQRGLWGVVISNPTDVPMTVSRVVINAYTSTTTGGGSSEMIASGSSCEDAVYPDVAGEWTCPHANMIQWKDVSSPEQVDPLTSKSFLARVVPGNPAEEPAFMVSVAVFTNMGQFTKTGYSSGISATGNAVANVFMSETDDVSDAYDDDNIITHKNGIASGSTVKLNVTLVDFDNANDKYIKSGTKLVINVPTDFTDVTVTSSTGFNTPTITEYSDGSTQIVADLSQAVGDVNSVEAKVLSFTAKAPTVTADKIYIMYALLDGESTPNDFSVGAIAEMPLQVVS